VRRRLRASPRAKAAPDEPARILVIEDQRLARLALHLILELDGYHVRVAGDGHRAIKVMRAFRPCLIIMDWRLPGLFGEELCREIRSTDPDVPIIIVSASDEAFSSNVAASARLRKPIDVRQLRAVVGSHVSPPVR